MKHTKGNWQIDKDHQTNRTGKITICVGNIKTGDDWKMVTEVSKNNETESNAKLIATAPEMLELLKDILVEVRPEISRINTDAGQTIFNPVATETIDMAKELISKAEGK